MSLRRASAILVAALAIAAFGGPTLGTAGGAAESIALKAHEEAPLTTFIAHRKNLEVALLVGPHKVVASRTSSLLHCEGGGKEQGTVTERGWRNFHIQPSGKFEKSSWESYEGSGDYFMAITGQIHRNRIVGEYRAWEERLGEEEFFPRCGTRKPRGEEMRFVAHRVDGPPWHPGRR